MKNNNPYSSGRYYQETYSVNYMNLEESSRWAMNYYKVIKNIFPEIVNYKNKKILEIGSGFGGFINVLNTEGFKNVIASDMIKSIFPKQLKNKYIMINLLDKNLPNEKYDLIFAFDVMEHINNTKKAINTIHQILVKNGLFIFSTPYPVKKHLMDKYHTNMQYPNYFINILKQSSFEIVYLQDVSFIPYIWRFKIPLFLKRIFTSRYCISETFYIFKKNN